MDKLLEGFKTMRFSIFKNVEIFDDEITLLIIDNNEKKMLALKTGYDKAEDRKIREQMEDHPLEYAEHLWNKYPQYIKDYVVGTPAIPDEVDNLL